MPLRTQRCGLATAGKTLARDAFDRELRQKVEAQLPHQRAHGQLGVEVKNGFVLLRGFVGTYREKERLHRFVMGLRGVRALKDLVRVRPVETLADRAITVHVRSALDAHAELPMGTFTVLVRKGVCTLRGHARSAEERHIAEQAARHCRGVRAVVNELNVDPLDEVPDAATARAVRCALDYCKDFATGGITVSCVDGRVVLRGTVPGLLDRALAEEIARLQPCVCAVENQIQVAPTGNGLNKRRLRL